jgi:hypothetical protein
MAKQQTPALASGHRIGGPKPGWAYVRCYSCSSIVSYEFATARTVLVAQKSAPGTVQSPTPTRVAAPPPFTIAPKAIAPTPRPEPAPWIDVAPHMIAPLQGVQPQEQKLSRPIPAPIPEPLPQLPSEGDEDIPGTSTAARGSSGGMLRAAASVGIVIASLAMTAHYAAEWLAQSRSPRATSYAKPANLSVSVDRAHAAAKRMQSAAPANVGGGASTAIGHPETIPTPPVSAQAGQPTQLAQPTPATPRLAARDARDADRGDTHDVRDSIHSAAMAPMRPRAADLQQQLFLQARKQVRALELRTGPGPSYPLLGYADLDERYPVVEWKDRWFKIQLEETPGLSAWVAYERVELFSKDKDVTEDLWR